MNKKKYKEKYDKKINKKDQVIKKYINIKWIFLITTIAFFITLVLTIGSDVLMSKVNVIVGILIILFFIIIGVLTDMIGVAVTSADEEPFHSMATKKIKGAKLAVKLIRNAEKVSAFCNDVIGDICGIMSGSAGIVVATSMSIKYDYSLTITTLIITSVIAALTIGGKATGKSFAINKSELIVYKFAKLCNIFIK